MISPIPDILESRRRNRQTRSRIQPREAIMLTFENFFIFGAGLMCGWFFFNKPEFMKGWFE